MKSGPKKDIPSELIGDWKLVSAVSSTSKGVRNETPYGVAPEGLLTYSADGRVTAMISYGDRKPLRAAASVQDLAEAYKTFISYTGRCLYENEKLIHHVEISSIQNYVGRDLVRTVKFRGNHLVLTTPPTPVNGKIQIIELTWERLPTHR